MWMLLLILMLYFNHMSRWHLSSLLQASTNCPSNPGYLMFFVNIGPDSERQRENGENPTSRRTWVCINRFFHLSLLKSTLPNRHISITRSTMLQICVISLEHLIISSVPLHHLYNSWWLATFLQTKLKQSVVSFHLHSYRTPNQLDPLIKLPSSPSGGLSGGLSGGVAEFSRLWISSAQNCAFMCFLPFFFFYFLFDTCIVCNDMYDRRTLLDIGQRYTNLIQNTLSADPAWPLEISGTTCWTRPPGQPQEAKETPREMWWNPQQTEEKGSQPSSTKYLLANVQSLENKMDDLRARISFQRDIRDCNIFCLTETWLTPTVPDTAVTPSDNFSVLRMDRSAEAGKNKGGGVCFFINKKWCDPGISPFCRIPVRLIWSISPLSAAHSICHGSLHRSSLLPSTFHHKQTLSWLVQTPRRAQRIYQHASWRCLHHRRGL